MSSYDDQFDWDDAVGGGFLTSYIGTVQSSEFGVDEEYRDDTVRLMWDIHVDSHDDPDSSVEPGDVFSEAFNVGNTSTWEATDGGKRVGKVDGKKPKFNNNSGYGQLITLATGKEITTKDGKVGLENADELAEVLKTRGPATDATIWTNLQFEFNRLTFGFTNRETNEEVEYSRVYPVRFIGEAGSGKARKAAAATKVEAESAPEVDADAGVTQDDLKAVAEASSSFDEFLANAMDKFPGVEDGELAAYLLDEESGAWAEVQA